jgi:hypothetical protein
LNAPIHAATGRRLVVERVNMHHASRAYVGELGEGGFTGRVRTAEYTYLEGPARWRLQFEAGITVVGVPVPD